MARIYAIVEGSDERVLVRIECDFCDNSIKPNPDIAESGWMKSGNHNDPGCYHVVYCPECWWGCGYGE